MPDKAERAALRKRYAKIAHVFLKQRFYGEGSADGKPTVLDKYWWEKYKGCEPNSEPIKCAGTETRTFGPIMIMREYHDRGVEKYEPARTTKHRDEVKHVKGTREGLRVRSLKYKRIYKPAGEHLGSWFWPKRLDVGWKERPGYSTGWYRPLLTKEDVKREQQRHVDAQLYSMENEDQIMEIIDWAESIECKSPCKREPEFRLIKNRWARFKEKDHRDQLKLIGAIKGTGVVTGKKQEFDYIAMCIQAEFTCKYLLRTVPTPLTKPDPVYDPERDYNANPLEDETTDEEIWMPPPRPPPLPGPPWPTR